MYLLYADESGDLRDPTVNVFVVGGIAVHEDAVRPFAGEVNRTINRYIGQKAGSAVELHGNPMRTGRAGWSSIAAAKRHGLAHALLKRVCDWTHPESGSEVEPFTIVIDRDHSQSPTETSYGELLYLFDTFLREGRKRGYPHNGVLIADRSRYERTLEAWVEVARARHQRSHVDPRRLYALAETPFFIDSRSTRLIQIADLVAHAMYRAYNSGDWNWANTLVPGLLDDRRLVHFTSDGACSCPACEAERVASAPAALGAPATTSTTT